MIFDNIRNCKLYYGANEKFEKAFEFIKKATDENYPVGKYELDGDSLYAMVQEYTTKPKSEAKYEAHEKYIDIQYMLSGIEEIAVFDIGGAEIEDEYNPEYDAAFYKAKEKMTVSVLEAGDFGIFYPNDIHRPGISYKENLPVRKIVVKVRV